MELLLTADALHRASANRITAVVPYYGTLAGSSGEICQSSNQRQSRRRHDQCGRRQPGSDCRSHAEQIQGFFSIPVDNVYGSPVLTEDIERQRYENLTVVSPDVGGVVRARAVAKQLNVDLAIIDKRRPTANDAQVMNIIGDVEGRSCLIVTIW